MPIILYSWVPLATTNSSGQVVIYAITDVQDLAGCDTPQCKGSWVCIQLTRICYYPGSRNSELLPATWACFLWSFQISARHYKILYCFQSFCPCLVMWVHINLWFGCASYLSPFNLLPTDNILKRRSVNLREPPFSSHFTNYQVIGFRDRHYDNHMSLVPIDSVIRTIHDDDGSLAQSHLPKHVNNARMLRDDNPPGKFVSHRCLFLLCLLLSDGSNDESSPQSCQSQRLVLLLLFTILLQDLSNLSGTQKLMSAIHPDSISSRLRSHGQGYLRHHIRMSNLTAGPLIMK